MSGPQRLSANLPRAWLFDREWRAMPDDARTLWVSILQFCIGETNGYLSSSELGMLLPTDPAQRQTALEWLLASNGKFRLVAHTRDGGGWRIPNWTSHNSTVATVDKHREKWRGDKRRQRARPKSEEMSTSGHHPWTKDKDKAAVREATTAELVSVNGRAAEPPPDWDCADGDCPEPENVVT
jgi:hypothetical protein